VNPAPDVAARLGELRPVYDSVRELLVRRTELRTVEQAEAAFKGLVDAEADALAGLTRRREELEASLRRRDLDPVPHEMIAPPPPLLSQERRPDAPRADRPPPAEPVRPAGSRQRLKRLVNRWAFRWELDDGLVARINAIVDDADRPAGEALALLPWAAFASPTSDQEAASTHLARLLEWADALGEYRGRLAGEVRMLEVRYRGLLGIWELWRRRESDPGGRARWLAFAADKRRALAAEAEEVRKAVADLEGRLSEGARRP
jgi:hypothetical protein